MNEKYIKKSLLGKGSRGTVWLVENKEECLVTVTIADYYERSKVEKNLKENGIEYTTIETLLNEDNLNIIEGNREYIADYH